MDALFFGWIGKDVWWRANQIRKCHSGTSESWREWVFHSNDAVYRLATNTHIGRESDAFCGPKSYINCTTGYCCHWNISINCPSHSVGERLIFLSSSDSSITAAGWPPTTCRICTVVSSPTCVRSLIFLFCDVQRWSNIFHIKGCSIRATQTCGP